ncbi:D-serine deaminase-like pyridoxal phosphate-dependent protein [Pontibacter mucosus]|uniref:D-serine deaminase-like pyridoxal phosphate-dependent protein n=1 Tax=Pontibacter mucosus TaxID=1649266 RepID=A0A2T5YQ22_9BACT|nr:alanine racemase [Pontibacter mucosus]PTX21402.1 D-serine deaminase-like pyridoxal phosphate-dependent protein [Pontibacter mucosus]
MNITTPTLLLDKEKALRNISRMVDKTKRSGVRLRPHFKTHQSVQVGEWFREQGVEAITVSSVHMARYFADHGWNDILVAFPANVLEMESINELASRIKLHLIAVNQETVVALAKGLQHPVQLSLKIDAGYHRTGIPASNYAEIDAMLALIQGQDKLQFAGFVVHNGHTYKQTYAAAIRNIHNTSVDQLQLLRERYKAQFPNLQLSVGDTPSCSILESFEGVDEIRPGNFVFYDITQQHIGSCAFEEIAVCMVCPVIAKHPDRGELILYGGSVHFSKDVLVQKDGNAVFGRVVELTDKGWSEPLEGFEVVSLSQEHGVVRVSAEQFDKYNIGDLMGVLPVHSCLTADAMRGYLTTEGEPIDHLSGVR